MFLQNEPNFIQVEQQPGLTGQQAPSSNQKVSKVLSRSKLGRQPAWSFAASGRRLFVVFGISISRQHLWIRALLPRHLAVGNLQLAQSALKHIAFGCHLPLSSKLAADKKGWRH